MNDSYDVADILSEIKRKKSSRGEDAAARANVPAAHQRDIFERIKASEISEVFDSEPLRAPVGEMPARTEGVFKEPPSQEVSFEERYKKIYEQNAQSREAASAERPSPYAARHHAPQPPQAAEPQARQPAYAPAPEAEQPRPVPRQDQQIPNGLRRPAPKNPTPGENVVELTDKLGHTREIPAFDESGEFKLPANTSGLNIPPSAYNQPYKINRLEADFGEGTYDVEEEIDDYTSPEQAKSIKHDLFSTRFSLSVRLVVTALTTLYLAYLYAAPLWELPIASVMDPASDPKLYIIVNIMVLVILSLFCSNTVGGGLISLITFKANNDSMASVAVLGTIAQGLVIVSNPQNIDLGDINVYFLFAALILVFNTIGKLFMISRIINDFGFLTKDSKNLKVALPIKSKEVTRELTRGQDVDSPKVLCCAPTKLVFGFLEESFAEDFTESVAKVLVPISFIFSLAISVVIYFFSTSFLTAATVFSLLTIICAPITSSFLGSFPIHKTSKYLVPQGAMLAGYRNIEKFCDSTAVMVEATDLFMSGDIVLYNIKTFGEQRIDEALIDAASVICESRSTLTEIFTNIIQGQYNLLKPVENLTYEDQMGLSAWVNGKRVLIGNRGLMFNHGIDVPSKDYEMKYVQEGRDILYLANSGQLTAMFALGYSASEDIIRELRKLERRDTMLIINTTDPNLTVERISKLFEYPSDLVKILSSKLQMDVARFSHPQEHTPIGLNFTDNALSLFKGLNASVATKISIVECTMLQLAGILVGYAMVLFFAFTSSLLLVGVSSLLLYQLFWFVIIFFIQLVRRR